MGYAIFSFAVGDYLYDEQDHLLLFSSRGLACQYMQEHYHNPVPKNKTKRVIHYPNYYQTPFRVHKVS